MEWLRGSYTKYALGGLGFLVVVWLLMRQQRNTAGGSSAGSGSVVVQPSYDPNAAAIGAQLQAAQIQSQQAIAANQAQAAAGVQIAQIAAGARVQEVAGQVQVAQIQAGAQTQQIIAQSQAALGITQAQADAAARIADTQGRTATYQAKYNTDAAIAIQNGINTADVQKVISTNQTQVQLYGIQAGVARDAIGSAASLDAAAIEASHAENMATLQAQKETADAYYKAALPLGLAQAKNEQDRFNTLATLYGKGLLLHSGETGANQLAGFLGLVNPDTAATQGIAASTVGVAHEASRGSVLNSIFNGIANIADAVFA